MVEDLHAGEEVAEVVGDEVLQRDEPHLVDGLALVDPHEARKHLRHLQAGELLLAGARVAHPHRQVERQARDVGERMRGVDRERHQHREDLQREDVAHLSAVGLVELSPLDHLDPGRFERRTHVLTVDARVAGHQLVRLLGDVREHILRRAPDVRRHREPGRDAPLQPGDTHHEELVQIVGEDGEEVRALEDRQRADPRPVRAPAG